MSGPQVVDSKVPRAKAWIHALLAGLGFLAGLPIAPYLLAATGLAMAASVLGGPRFSIFGRLFNSVIRPALRIQPGRPEDPRPHRFAEALGAISLLAAAVFYATGPVVVGQVLSLMVVALALLNAVGGICVGCQIYLLLMRRPLTPTRPESKEAV